MRQFMSRPAASVAALAAAAVLVTGGVRGAGRRRDEAGAAGPRRGAASAPARTIVLLNGDKLVTGPAAGVPGLVPGARGRLAGPMLALDLGGQAYDIPQVALPYLGRGLDPDLFRVSSLLREETAARLPVTVSYRGRVPSLPGVTISRAAGGTARGYLTAAGAAAFGAALARQFIADHARGSYGQDGLFAGGVSIRLAGLPGTGAAGAGLPDAHPHGHRHQPGRQTRHRRPGDDLQRRQLQPVRRSGRVSELLRPRRHEIQRAGRALLGNRAFPDLPPEEREIEWHVPILPQFTVSANTTVHIDERTADSLIGVKTPRAAVPVNETLELRHPGAAGPAASTWLFGGYAPLFISPTTRRPTVGTIQAYVFEQLFSPAKATGTPYEYDAAFADTSGLIPPQHYVVRPSGLATVHARYYSDVSTTGYGVEVRGVSGAVEDHSWGPVPRPADAAAADGVHDRQPGDPVGGHRWSSPAESLAGGQLDELRTFHAGEQLAENWNAYPLHAGYNTNLIGAANLSPTPAPPIPSASRKGNALALDVMPFSDSTLGHVSASGFFGGFGGIVREDHRSLRDRRERQGDRGREPAAG